MKVTWTVNVKIKGVRGNQAQCRDEAEAARLVLELVLAGVKLYQIIVDGVRQEQSDKKWIWKALGS